VSSWNYLSFFKSYAGRSIYTFAKPLSSFAVAKAPTSGVATTPTGEITVDRTPVPTRYAGAPGAGVPATASVTT